MRIKTQESVMLGWTTKVMFYAQILQIFVATTMFNKALISTFGLLKSKYIQLKVYLCILWEIIKSY